MLFVNHNRDPYLKQLDKIGPHEVWLVDGGHVRKHLEEEFTNYGHGRDPMFRGKIPMNEFWIEVGSEPEEFPFFIDRMLAESYYLSKLMPHLKAERESMKVENIGRQRARKDRGEYKDNGINVHILELTYPNLKTKGVKIWLIDGKKVRDHMDNFFCHGGHSLVYPDYVPAGPPQEIWIDNTAPKNEHDFLLIHELHEYNRMADGETYKTAHPKASRIEYECRWSPQEKDKQMRELGLK
jgi:hypothetical protein